MSPLQKLARQRGHAGHLAGNEFIAREVVEQFGGLKQPERTIGTGPFLLERYEDVLR